MAAVTVSLIRHGTRLVVVLDGDLDMASAPGALAAIDQLLTEPLPGRVVIDLARVGFLDSSGLAVLAEVLRQGGALDFRLRSWESGGGTATSSTSSA